MIHIANSLQGFLMRRTLKRGERTIRVANGVEANAEALGDFTLILHTTLSFCYIMSFMYPQ